MAHLQKRQRFGRSLISYIDNNSPRPARNSYILKKCETTALKGGSNKDVYSQIKDARLSQFHECDVTPCHGYSEDVFTCTAVTWLL